MRRHLKRNVRKVSLFPSQRKWSRPIFPEKRYEVAGSILRITTYLPRPVALKARREIYSYPYPRQRQKRGRTIRLSLRPTVGRFVKTVVRIRLPRRLPRVRGSYVSLANGSLNIHSTNQVKDVLNAQEYNRRRYGERKGNVRKGRYGQLDSPGSLKSGGVAYASRSGHSIDQIADAALVSRALAQNQKRWR